MTEGDAIEREIFVAAAPDIVFGFLIDATLMAKWIGLFHTLDPRPGGVFQVEVSRGNVARGVYTEVTPFRRVAFTWGWETPSPPDPEQQPPQPSEAAEPANMTPEQARRASYGPWEFHTEKWELAQFLCAAAAALPLLSKFLPLEDM